MAINGTERLAPYVAANVNLWPETVAIVVGESRFAGLTPTQQGWLQEAATRASRGSLAMLSDETKTLAKLRRRVARGPRDTCSARGSRGTPSPRCTGVFDPIR